MVLSRRVCRGVALLGHDGQPFVPATPMTGASVPLPGRCKVLPNRLADGLTYRTSEGDKVEMTAKLLLLLEQYSGSTKITEGIWVCRSDKGWADRHFCSIPFCSFSQLKKGSNASNNNGLQHVVQAVLYPGATT